MYTSPVQCSSGNCKSIPSFANCKLTIKQEIQTYLGVFRPAQWWCAVHAVSTCWVHCLSGSIGFTSPSLYLAISNSYKASCSLCTLQTNLQSNHCQTCWNNCNSGQHQNWQSRAFGAWMRGQEARRVLSGAGAESSSRLQLAGSIWARTPVCLSLTQLSPH